MKQLLMWYISFSNEILEILLLRIDDINKLRLLVRNLVPFEQCHCKENYLIYWLYIWQRWRTTLLSEKISWINILIKITFNLRTCPYLIQKKETNKNHNFASFFTRHTLQIWCKNIRFLFFFILFLGIVTKNTKKVFPIFHCIN